MDRTKNLERIRSAVDPFDVVVVGGGATGVGCALDAASRGLSVLLLEKADFGKGTSGRSTKLIHGGVRYLEQGNLSLVREALSERRLLARIAGDHVKEIRFAVPAYKSSDRLYYGAGLRFYDLLAGKDGFRKAHSHSRESALEELPGVKPDGLRGAISYSDAQFDDTRFLISLAARAESLGAVVLNYAEVTGLIEGKNGKASGVEFIDRETDERVDVRSRAVINACGIFADSIGENESRDPRLTFSRGSHIVLERDFLPGENALMIPRTSDGRVLFLIPWLGRLLVGTTDIPTESPSFEPLASEEEIEFLLETAGRYLARKPVRSDIKSVFAGIRPLVSQTGIRKTSRLSREHSVVVGESGMIEVLGGKWTTYRRMAQDAVDTIVSMTGLESGRSLTHEIVIPESNEARIAALIAEDSANAEPVGASEIYMRADVLDAVRSEMARKIEDVLARRTRLLMIDARAAIEASEVVAEIMAEELGWDDTCRKKEVEEFKALAVNYLPGN